MFMNASDFEKTISSYVYIEGYEFLLPRKVKRPHAGNCG